MPIFPNIVNVLQSGQFRLLFNLRLGQSRVAHRCVAFHLDSLSDLLCTNVLLLYVYSDNTALLLLWYRETGFGVPSIGNWNAFTTSVCVSALWLIHIFYCVWEKMKTNRGLWEAVFENTPVVALVYSFKCYSAVVQVPITFSLSLNVKSSTAKLISSCPSTRY